MHYFSNKFSKIAKRSPQHPLVFDSGDLESRNLGKLWFFKQIITKLNFKNYLWVV